MRARWLLAVLLVGCEDAPPCGVDDDGADVPFCSVVVEGY